MIPRAKLFGFVREPSLVLNKPNSMLISFKLLFSWGNLQFTIYD